jgi:selenocysteine lyase/cysteine desulfurase
MIESVHSRVSHMQVDVQVLDCDFFVFCGHKLFAPTWLGLFSGNPKYWMPRRPGKVAAT